MKRSNIVIEKATTADAVRLAHASREFFRQAYEGKMLDSDIDDYAVTEFSEAKKFAELNDPTVTTIIAEYEQAIIGYAQIRKNPLPLTSDEKQKPELELWRIYLAKAYQGCGIGSLLFSKLAWLTESDNDLGIWLGVWDQNADAISFYENLGFRITGSQQFTVGSDIQNDLIMVGSLVSD